MRSGGACVDEECETTEDARALLGGGARALHIDGDLQTSREWYDAAYRAAERDGDGWGMADAALGLCGLWVHEHRSAAAAAVARDRLDQALAAVVPQSLVALRLRARLAGEADYRTGGHAAILALLEDARRTGDPVTRAEAVSLAHHCLLGPGNGPQRRELAEELIALAARTGRRGDLVMGLLWRTVDLILDADPKAGRSLAELREMLDRRPHLAVGYVLRAIDVMLAIRAGRFAEAEADAMTCFERGRTAGDADATGWFAGHMVAIRWYQGRVSELVPLLHDLMHSPTLSATDNWPLAALAVAAAGAGDQREAHSVLARLGGFRGLDRLPRSSSWLATMYGIIEAAHLVDDVEVATAAYDLLSPFADLPLVAGIGVVCFGSVRHALGLASLTAGETDRAVGLLRSSVRDNLALAHWPATVLSRVRLAEALVRRCGPGDLEEAEQALDRAATEAAGLGMPLPPSAVTVRAALDRSTGGRDAQLFTGRSPVAGPVPVAIERRGRQWQVSFGRRNALVESSVGMRYLATLTANPGYELPAIELAAGADDPAAALERGTGSHQPVLDEVAVREYRSRLASLAEEIDKYELSNDLGRAEVARAEREWLIAELTAAAGLGGRVREFTSGEERARISVGKAIRRALDRIGAADPIIGDELRATVQTGLRCCYRPR